MGVRYAALSGFEQAADAESGRQPQTLPEIDLAHSSTATRGCKSKPAQGVVPGAMAAGP